MPTQRRRRPAKKASSAAQTGSAVGTHASTRKMSVPSAAVSRARRRVRRPAIARDPQAEPRGGAADLRGGDQHAGADGREAERLHAEHRQVGEHGDCTMPSTTPAPNSTSSAGRRVHHQLIGADGRALVAPGVAPAS